MFMVLVPYCSYSVLSDSKYTCTICVYDYSVGQNETQV